MFMNIIREFRYKDIFANSAKIEEVMMRPFDGAEEEVGYRLMCYSDYDGGFLYHCACYETFSEAHQAMMKLSCGKWRQIA